jgi:hypothetical protein
VRENFVYWGFLIIGRRRKPGQGLGRVGVTLAGKGAMVARFGEGLIPERDELQLTGRFLEEDGFCGTARAGVGLQGWVAHVEDEGGLPTGVAGDFAE